MLKYYAFGTNRKIINGNLEHFSTSLIHGQGFDINVMLHVQAEKIKCTNSIDHWNYGGSPDRYK